MHKQQRQQAVARVRDQVQRLRQQSQDTLAQQQMANDFLAMLRIGTVLYPGAVDAERRDILTQFLGTISTQFEAFTALLAQYDALWTAAAGLLTESVGDSDALSPAMDSESDTSMG